MKHSRNLFTAIVSFAILAAVSFTPVYSFAQDLKVPTKKELATLLKTAKEPADHLRIAAFYKQEAARQRQIAKEHTQFATVYEQSHPDPAMETKHSAMHGDTFGRGASHCRKFAELALEEAKEDDALVALHENMAKEAGQKQ